MVKGYDEFAELMREKESGGDYSAVNRFGYLGAYQFGRPRLYDLGISLDGWRPFAMQELKYISQEEFLHDKKLQDELFELHVADYLAKIRKHFGEYMGQTINGVKVTLSGSVAVAHLKGFGNKENPGLKQYLEQGIDDADGFGTKMSDYMKNFAGFDLKKKRKKKPWQQK